MECIFRVFVFREYPCFAQGVQVVIVKERERLRHLVCWPCQPPKLKLDGVLFVEGETSVSINECHWKLWTLCGTLKWLGKKRFVVGGSR